MRNYDSVDWALMRREYEAGASAVDLAQKYEANATAIRQRVYREKWVKPDKEQEVEPMTNSRPLNIEALAKSMSVGACNSSPVPSAVMPGPAIPVSLSRSEGTGDIAQSASPEEISGYVEVMVRDVIDTLAAIRRLPAPKTRKNIIEHERLVGMHLDRAQKVLGVFRKGVEGTGTTININALARSGR
ncbi:hypothetical protein OAH36_02555 [Verrucomicrobia bacterium]|nr:hypothetical protein [Verrucomicrobiota bacterium]